jgi:hypothetical protein
MSRETITVHSDGTNPVESVSRSLQGHLDADGRRVVEVEVTLTTEPVADPDSNTDETNADPPTTGGRSPNARLNSPGRISQATGRHEILMAMAAVGATSAEDGISAVALHEAAEESVGGLRSFSHKDSVSSALSRLNRAKHLVDRAKQQAPGAGVTYEYWLNDAGLAELERLKNDVFEFDVDL